MTDEAYDLDEVDSWARTNDVECMYLLCPDRPGDAIEAENAGFRLMDVRVELARRATAEPSSLRPAAPEDALGLRKIARVNHRVTRFYADPNFPDARCDDLYETWIARSLEGWADAVFVVEEGERLAGYVTVHLKPEVRWGSIGLIGVDESVRRRGLGRQLVRGAVAWSREQGMREVWVTTQLRNVPALRTFEACGFRAMTYGLWFHKWYSR